MSRGTWVGVLIIVLLLAATITWTYLSTVTELPNLGFGLAVNRWVLFAILVVLAVVLGAVFFGQSGRRRGG